MIYWLSDIIMTSTVAKRYLVNCRDTQTECQAMIGRDAPTEVYISTGQLILGLCTLIGKQFLNVWLRVTRLTDHSRLISIIMWMMFIFCMISLVLRLLSPAVNCGRFCFWRRQSVVFCLFVLCVWNISGTAEPICAKFTWKTCMVSRSGEFEGQGHM